MNNIYINAVNKKKSVHISMSQDVHTLFKIECTKRDLSMQEVFEAFANKISTEDPKFVKFLEEVKKNKLEGVNNTKSLNKSDIDNIYRMLENEEDSE